MFRIFQQRRRGHAATHAPAGAVAPDITRPFRGSYPRWWILSMYLTAITVGVGYLLWFWSQDHGCIIHGPSAFLCHFDSWFRGWQEIRDVVVWLLIWLVFWFYWLLIMIFGIGPIEIPGKKMYPLARFIRDLSQFQAVRGLIIGYAVVASVAIASMWLLELAQPVVQGHHTPHILQPAPYALATILIFLAICDNTHRITDPEDRSLWFLLLGILALIIAIALFLMGWDWASLIILVPCIILFLVAVWMQFRRRPQPARPLTPQELLEASNARATTPSYIFRSLWPVRRMFPNQPVQNAPGQLPPDDPLILP